MLHNKITVTGQKHLAACEDHSNKYKMIHKDEDDIPKPSMLKANEGSTMHCMSIFAAL